MSGGPNEAGAGGAGGAQRPGAAPGGTPEGAPRLAARADGVASLLLNRPARGNALGPDLVEALHEALAAAFADPAVHTVTLAGAGRNFCTGLDLSEAESLSDGDLLHRLVRIEQLLDAVWRAPVRTVALAAGRTWGAGADLFAACDLRFADAQASFRFPGAGFGIVLGTRQLAERIGADRARVCVETGATLDAAAALDAGLASHVVAQPFAPEALAARAELPAGAPPAPAIDRETLAAIRAASRPDRSDADLAALVRSAARPGLKDRVLAYRARVAAQRR